MESMEKKFVFTLNNQGTHHDHSAMCFVITELLLDYHNSTIKEFIDNSNLFTRRDFDNLNKRVAIDAISEVGMNATHLSIFYSVIHIACKYLLDEKFEVFFRETLHYSEKDFLDIRDKVLTFGSIATQKFDREYNHISEIKAVKTKLAKLV